MIISQIYALGGVFLLDREEFIVVGSRDNSINIVKLKFDDNDFKIESLYDKTYNNKIMLHSCMMQENNIYILDSFNNLMIKYDIENNEYLECYTGKDPRHICKCRDNIYVTNFESDSIAIIDDKSCTLTGSIAVSSKPHDIVAHQENNKLYIACYEENEILEYNIDSSEKKRINIGGKSMHLILFNNYLFAMAYKVNGNISSEIYIINLDNYNIEKKYLIDEMTGNFVYDEDTNMLYVLAIESGTVYSIDLNNEQIRKQVHLSGYLESIFVSKKHLYIADTNKDNITITDKAVHGQIKIIALSFSPIYVNKL